MRHHERSLAEYRDRKRKQRDRKRKQIDRKRDTDRQRQTAEQTERDRQRGVCKARERVLVPVERLIFISLGCERRFAGQLTQREIASPDILLPSAGRSLIACCC